MIGLFGKSIFQNGKKTESAVPDILLFTHWNRFSRNIADAYAVIGRLSDMGIQLQAIEQPLDLSIPENKIMLAMYLASSEVENDRRAITVKQGIRKAKQEGRWTGLAPKGYRNQSDHSGRKTIVPVAAEADLIKKAFELVAEGEKTTYEIYRQMVSCGLVCSESHFWNMLRNPVYCGMVTVPPFEKYHSYTVKGIHKPIVSIALFSRVQKMLKSRENKPKTRYDLDQFLPLRGLLVCPKCGRCLTGSKSKGNTQSYFYYHCQAPCRFRTSAKRINDSIVNELRQLRPAEHFCYMFGEILKQKSSERMNKYKAKQKELSRNIDRIVERISRAKAAMDKGEIDLDDFVCIKKECKRTLDMAVAEFEEVVAALSNLKGKLKKVMSSFTDLGTFYRKCDIQTKKRLLRIIFTKPFLPVDENIRAYGNKCFKRIFISKSHSSNFFHNNMADEDAREILNSIAEVLLEQYSVERVRIP